MKSLFRNIVRAFVRRLYPYWLQVQKEHKQQAIQKMIAEFSSCGADFKVGNDSRIEGCEFISIGESFSAGDHLRMEAIDRYGQQHFHPRLVIGNHVRIEDNCHIGCVEQVEIGDDTLIASKVFISDHSHGNVDKSDIDVAPLSRPLVSKLVKIGQNVWIGDGACILPGVELGDNVVVGANAVVTHNFSANAVIAGCPAKLIRMLDAKAN